MLGDWVAGIGRNLTDIFITHGHGDHWFAAGLLAERFGARVVATAGTIAQMHANVAMRPLLWDKVYVRIPPSPVTAVTVPGNRFTLEGHDLVIVEVGHTDSDDTSILHAPDLGLVVAGDAIYNGVHMYLGQSMTAGGFGPWRDAIDKVEALRPRHIVAGHQNKQLDDDAGRTIAETRRYLDDADELLQTESTAVASSPRRWSGTRTTSAGPSCGSVPVRSTACANTRDRTSAKSFSPPGCKPRQDVGRAATISPCRKGVEMTGHSTRWRRGRLAAAFFAGWLRWPSRLPAPPPGRRRRRCGLRRWPRRDHQQWCRPRLGRLRRICLPRAAVCRSAHWQPALAPPQPQARWLGVRDATQFAPSCPQGTPTFTQGPTSEDCLYLNVSTPTLRRDASRPVLVWIHGGGFTTSTGRDYDPSALTADGAVVVTINYRLGALGFLAHPALASRPGGPAGNYGLMDQQAALRWVQANIGRFGGNPHNVTIAGESAAACPSRPPGLPRLPRALPAGHRRKRLLRADPAAPGRRRGRRPGLRGQGGLPGPERGLPAPPAGGDPDR